MTTSLQFIKVESFTTHSGTQFADLSLSYQTFGKPLGTAPVVLVNHALTGNSNVTGEGGWWSDLIGPNKPIDTHRFTVLAFNIPGNCFDGLSIDKYQEFIAKDIAVLFLNGLNQLKIEQLYAIIGGSLGGGIAWEMVLIDPSITENLIPIATDWKSTDWLIANCRIQEQFLENSSQPIHDARMHAMLCYRTPESFKQRFDRTENEQLGIFNIESWLLHHGKKLQERFQLSAYKMMNQLLKTIGFDASYRDVGELTKIEANIHIIGVDSDLFFLANENRETYKSLVKQKSNVHYHEIKSIHGHDAFLIEYDQLEAIVSPIFKRAKIAA
ncbi:MAG: homoserine acetyltransferase [Flavobacteriaceae bacterium]|nr:homoserine acetyltransferase [Flavobacteriaceae bacterium]|tara:strand:- start:23245 stop:24225 length:981 start_codon:yes stop_codon:yes gene_type:complete